MVDEMVDGPATNKDTFTIKVLKRTRLGSDGRAREERHVLHLAPLWLLEEAREYATTMQGKAEDTS